MINELKNTCIGKSFAPRNFCRCDCF